ncbi:MAG: zinc ABC transporter substrate-binding protein [Alphaproteobacteria bacterium]|nr:zinc ABC transporter substrate-binding protein [Alphaproteobacteria bacterium]
MNRVIAYGCFLALITLTAQASQAAWQPHVLVVAPVTEPIISEVVRGIGKTSTLLNVGQSLHHKGFTPGQITRLNAAEVIVAIDKNIAPALTKLLTERAKKGASVIYLSELDGAEPLAYRAENPFLSAGEVDAHHEEHEGEEHHHHHHHKKTNDPHLWLDPLRIANLLPALTDKLGDYWPEQRANFAHNATRYALHLRAEVQPGISNIIAAAKQRQSDSSKAVPVMTYHDAYQYFQKRYGLEAGYITQRPEEYQGAKTMKQLLEKANKTHVRCIFSETSNHHVKRIAELSQADVVTLNPERPYTSNEVPFTAWASNGYERMLLMVAKAYARCL